MIINIYTIKNISSNVLVDTCDESHLIEHYYIYIIALLLFKMKNSDSK